MLLKHRFAKSNIDLISAYWQRDVLISDTNHFVVTKHIQSKKPSCPQIGKNCKFSFYYSTVLGIVQKTRETSTNIPRYCTVGYCTVAWARSSCHTCSFLSSYWKRLKKVKLENKFFIRCFDGKYRRIFLLVVCIFARPVGSSKYCTARKNIQRYFTPKHVIRYIYDGKFFYFSEPLTFVVNYFYQIKGQTSHFIRNDRNQKVLIRIRTNEGYLSRL